MNNKLLLPLATLFFGFVVNAFSASEEKLNRQFDVHSGGKLVVDVDFGRIDVSPGADDKVSIEAFRKIDFGDEAKEKQYLAAVPVTISAEGDTVTVRARSSKNERHHSWHHSSMDGQYAVRVPKNFSAKLDSGGGSMAVRELAGELRVNSGGGSLKFAQLQGARVAKTGGGSIDLVSCEGANDIETGGGDISLADGKGMLRARTSGGAITVRDFFGDTDVETGGGELILEKIAGRIAGETGGGSIIASVSGNAANEINLESSGGSIDLTLPATAAVDVDAAISSGRIKTSLPFDTTRMDEDHLRGKLNGGGKRVVLRTSAGSITIKPSSNETASR